VDSQQTSYDEQFTSNLSFSQHSSKHMNEAEVRLCVYSYFEM